MLLEDFKNKHAGSMAFIVGKGPSLDRADKLKYEFNQQGVVVLCLNQSIHKIEELGLTTPLYVVQQDSELGSDCVPSKATTVHFMSAWQDTPERRGKTRMETSPHNPNAVLYWHEIAHESDLSAIAALKLCLHMGIDKVCFVAFDSWANGWQGDSSYASCIKPSSREPGPHGVNGCWILECARKWMSSVETRLPTVKW